MKIGIIGTGYVGLVSSVCFAHTGHTVIAIDKRRPIVEALSRKEPTIYEENLAQLLDAGITSGRLHFSDAICDVKTCEIVFIAVGTPSLPNGHADLSQIYSAIDQLLDTVDDDAAIAVRSTIPVGTMHALRTYLTKKKRCNPLGFCPEFLREGVAISDFLHPHKVVLASDSDRGISVLHRAYKPLLEQTSAPLICCKTFETAEIIKYASNAFLAAKITFVNQIAQLSQAAGADISQITEGMGLDPRIGSQFLQPGPGYGGSCFPKDTIALAKCGLSYGIDISVIEVVHRANTAHQNFVSSWILETLGNAGIYGAGNDEKRPVLCVWGLAFKANTDDTRDSPALAIVRNFVDAGFAVQCYDPKGSENFTQAFKSPHALICSSEIDAARGAHALVVLTEWPQFTGADALSVCKIMNSLYVFDTRNILDAQLYKHAGAKIYKLGTGEV